MSGMVKIMLPSTPAAKTAGGPVKGFFARGSLGGRVSVAKEAHVYEEEDYEEEEEEDYEEEDYEEEDVFRSARRPRGQLGWWPSSANKPKPPKNATLVAMEDEDVNREDKIHECTFALGSIRETRKGLEVQLGATAAQQGLVDERWEAADAVYKSLTSKLDRLCEVSLPAILEETAESRNARCARPLADLQAAKEVLRETNRVSNTAVPRPGTGRLPRDLHLAWTQALTRRTQATDAIPECKARVTAAEEALATLVAAPERNMRMRIATCEDEVTAAAAERSKCRDAKVHADRLRIQLDNLGVYEARAVADLHHATCDGYEMLQLGQSRQPKPAATIARLAMEEELEALESDPPQVEVGDWMEVDKVALSKMRAAIEAKYAIKEEEVAVAPTRATATVAHDGVLTFAELLRWRHELPEAAAPEPVRTCLFPNARVLTDEEARALAAQTESLFVSNLSDETVVEDLHKLFRQYGDCRITLPRDRRTDAIRGHAFVNYERIQDAQAALRNLNGYRIRSMVISVKQAKERVDRVPAEAEAMVRAAGGGAADDRALDTAAGRQVPESFFQRFV